MDQKMIRALEYVDTHFETYLTHLKDFIRIPSATSDREASSEAAHWIADRLMRMELQGVQVFETIGNPVVFAEKPCLNKAAPTLLVYGHYDVQPAEPLAPWISAPFEPELRGDYLYGRGSSDMKGQILACLLAVEALIIHDDPNVHLKFLIEGNEETLPDTLTDFVPEHRSLLQADISLNCDAGMLGADQPTISYGLRGGSINIIRVMGPSIDLHDGMFGGAIENPIHVLSQLIAGLHDKHAGITLPGFYDKVRKLSKDERSLLAALPLDVASYKGNAGVSELWGDPDFSPVERTGARPSLNIRMFSAGSEKNAIPSMAEARVGIRLVPDQDPLEAFDQLRRYVEQNIPPTVTAEVEHLVGFPAYILDRSLPAIQTLATALEAAWDRKPYYFRVGGGIPVVGLLKQTLGIESLLTGFSLPDDHIHGPNERLHLPTVRKGIAALIHFFHLFGQVTS